MLVDNTEHESTDEDIEDTIEVNEYESTLLVNSILENKINAGDIRKLISASTKCKHSPTISQKGAFKSEVNINGKNYREVEKHIIY